MKRLSTASVLVATGGVAGLIVGGGFAQTPDMTQMAKLGAAGALLGIAAGGLAAALTQKKSMHYGLVGGVALLLGGWIASSTRTEVLSGGAGLSGVGRLTPAIQYYAPITR